MMMQTPEDGNVGTTGFAAGTKVHTLEGLKPIEDIEVGDRVLTYRDDQGPHKGRLDNSQRVYAQVSAIFVQDDKLVCEVLAWDLGNDVLEVLKVTPDQPIYIKGAGWTPAGKVKLGNVLFNSDFANLLVKKKKEANERAQIYNIDVEEMHTYFVGELGIWVHNKARNLPAR